MLLYLPFALLLTVFPDGRLPGRGARRVAVALVVTVFAFVALASGALGTSPVVQGAAVLLLPMFLALLVGCVLVARRRFQSANHTVRRQLRWLLLAAGSVPLTLLLCWASYLLLGTVDLVVLGLAFMYVAFPVATAIAILRHDLYDVDRALVSTVVYLAVAAALLAVFSTVAIFAGLAIGRGSTVIAVVATAACAIALNPVRAWLERIVRGWITPDRERALSAIEELQAMVHAGRSQPEQLESVLQAALRDPGLRVGYRIPGREQLVDTSGNPVADDGQGTPLRLAGEQIGVLLSGPDAAPPGTDVADAAALLAETARLRRVLGDALREVEASRSRLVKAGYDERRRLEQDLHDGAQQRLVSLGMRLRIAQRHLPAGSDLDDVLDQAVAEIATAVAELRQIAHGLRPSSLDDGLAAALANLSAQAPVPIDVALDAVDLSDEVSTTAYYVASEAVANAVKYADAEHIALRVLQQDGHVRVVVADDGRGGAALRPGAGLASLVDRVGALGGRLQVASPAGHGTVVEAVLPCGS
jgi:signal transduction histidine kinase